MHACELVELAALATAHGPALWEQTAPLPLGGLHQYWSASKCRVDRWRPILKAALAVQPPEDLSPSQRRALASVLVEIFSSDVLVRVWTSILTAHDRRLAQNESGPIARGVFFDHLEVRNRALEVLLRSADLLGPSGDAIDCVRRRADRWSDVLIGKLMSWGEGDQFAADPSRAADFAADFSGDGQAMRQLAWPMLMSSLRGAFAATSNTSASHGVGSPNADLNWRIAASVVHSFPPERLTSPEALRWLWLARISNVADDAQRWLGEVLDDRVSLVL